MATLTTKVKPFIIQSIIDALQNVNPPSWLGTTQYSLGAQVTNAGNIYACTQAGVSGSSGPQATSLVADGSCVWLYLRNAKSAGAINSNLYVSIGHPAAWPNDTAPPAEDTSDAGLESVVAQSTCLLQLTSSNARQGLKTNAWVTGTVYTAYTGVDGDTNGYVSVSTGDIYKCLDNNLGGSSTVVPSGQSVTPFSTSDGYVWKYLGSANAIDITTFGTTQFIPISVATASGSVQYDVQNSAEPGELSSFVNPYSVYGTGTISTVGTKVFSYNGSGTSIVPSTNGVVSVTLNAGAPQHIFTTTPGAGYGSNTWAFVYDGTAVDGLCAATAAVTSGAVSGITISAAGTAYPEGAVAVIVGDGTGAVAVVTVDSTDHTINSITVGAAGTGYTWAKVIILPGAVAWQALAIIGPALGHGSNIVTELGASGLLLAFDITSTLSPYVQSVFTYRQIALVSSVQPVPGYGSNYFAYIGPTHPSWNGGAYSATDPYKYLPASGEVLYVNNYTPVDHTTANEEIVKISISF
jgi:hypothetical protein